MKQQTDSSLRNDALFPREVIEPIYRQWMKVNSSNSANDFFIYLLHMRQETNPTAIIGSGVEATKGKWEFDGEEVILCNDKVIADIRSCNHAGEELENLVFNDNADEARANATLICEAVNNYQALRDSNAELMENLERILDRIKESDLILCFQSAYKRAKEALNKAKSIK
jgi:hypothetical protein